MFACDGNLVPAAGSNRMPAPTEWEPNGPRACIGGGSCSVGGRLLDEHEEAELIERAQRGDAGAFEAIVTRYQDLAFRTAYVITGDAAEAEEAASTGFLKAYHALARFRTGAPLRPWLLKIVANEARNRRTAARRHPTLALSAVEDRPSVEPALSPEVAALAAEQRRLLLAAVDGLREEDRLVIAYRYFLDLSEAEMAEALGCARGTVKSRLSRALGRLRERMSADSTREEARRG
jgi:RNA polymerase sigma-70 factor (ECF subfamily)